MTDETRSVAAVVGAMVALAVIVSLAGCQPIGVIKLVHCFAWGPATVSADVVRAVETTCQ